MYMLYKLRQLDLKVEILERASDVGGTWYWNRYPGARCDIESIEYSYSFSEELQQDWVWSNRYSDQTEILSYAGHVADRFNLRKDINFDLSVDSARYDENSKKWEIITDSKQKFTASFCVMATGTLSSIKDPDFDGLDSFEGDWYLTGKWPHSGVDFTNKKVAIIGTGSSAVQSIPVIAKQAKDLKVFQRTPNYSIPAENRPLTEKEIIRAKSSYSDIRNKARYTRAGISYNQYDEKKLLDLSEAERINELNKRWQIGGQEVFLSGFTDVAVEQEANDLAAEFVRHKIHEIVKDPKTANLLSPKNTIGCKRLCADTNLSLIHI